ncbi:MAG: 50S ribosomal protein L32 [Candidatus Omnitrophica bacterium]|nr:50S ribosomal protein L32 [Candidatus Omnitrophota bacterium]
MPLPKRRFSRARRDKRRLQDNLKLPSFTRCGHCGASIVSHRVCPLCGYYRGRQVVPVEAEKGEQK